MNKAQKKTPSIIYRFGRYVRNIDILGEAEDEEKINVPNPIALLCMKCEPWPLNVSEILERILLKQPPLAIDSKSALSRRSIFAIMRGAFLVCFLQVGMNAGGIGAWLNTNMLNDPSSGKDPASLDARFLVRT